MITRLRAPLVTDRYGNQQRDWPNASRSELVGCALAPRSAFQTEGEPHLQNRGAVIIGYSIYCPPGADLAATDRVDLDGDVYEVEGQPGVWINPLTNTNFGVEAALRRIEG